MDKMIKHDNSKMSLAVYLSVEKPNKHVRHTLGQIFIESPIVMVQKLKNNNIEVWSQVKETDEAQLRPHDKFTVQEVDPTNGEILSTREVLQKNSLHALNLGK
jgi:hypothetical protein